MKLGLKQMNEWFSSVLGLGGLCGNLPEWGKQNILTIDDTFKAGRNSVNVYWKFC